MLVLRNFSKLFTTVGQILAFLTVAILGLIYLNDVLPVHFLGDFYNTLVGIKDYAVIVSLTVCGMAFACRRSIILFALFCILALCALACYSIVFFKLFN